MNEPHLSSVQLVRADTERDALRLRISELEAQLRSLAGENRKLTANQARLVQILDSLPGLAGYVDLNLTIVYANRLLEVWYQRPRSELVGQQLQMLFADAHYKTVEALLGRVLSGQEINEEREIVYPDGVTRVVHLNYIPDKSDGTTKGYFFLVRDVSKRSRAEEGLRAANQLLDQRIMEATRELEFRNRELQASEERYRVVSELMSDLVYLYQIEPDGRMIAVWYAGRLSTEFAPQETEDGHSRLWGPIVHPDDHVILEARLERLLQNKTSIDEFRVINKSGSTCWLRAYGKPVWSDEEQRVVRIMVAAQDITEARSAEQKLARNRAMLTEALDSMSDGFMLLDEAHRLVVWNEKLKELFPSAAPYMKSGVHFNELLRAGAYGGDVKDAFDHPEEWIRERLANYPSVSEAVEIELPEGRWILSTDRPTRAGGVVGIRTDITARKQAEEQLRVHEMELAHVLRRSSMGEMASALAHELGQPLAAIVNYANGSLRRIDETEPDVEVIRDALDRIRKSGERAKGIVQHVRDFVRQGDPEMHDEDLRDVVNDVCELVRGSLRRNRVRLIRKLSDKRVTASVNRLQVEQVLVNLLRNGIEAMSGSEDGARRLEVSCEYAQDNVPMVSVADTGCGISREVADKLFEPYVTTKSDGLGMGLSITRTIVEAHGGRLWYESTPPCGTRFSFRLPAIGSLT